MTFFRNTCLFRLTHLFVGILMFSTHINAAEVDAQISTKAMLGGGDKADDPAIWLNNSQLSSSLVFGTNKSKQNVGGIYAFDLDGTSARNNNEWKVGTNLFAKGNRYNNVDVKYNFPAGNERWDIVSASNRTTKKIDVFRVLTNASGDFNGLDKVGVVSLGSGFPTDGSAPYGLSMFHAKNLNKYFVLISDKDGQVAQYQLSYNANGSGQSRVTGQRVAGPIQISSPDSEVEGMVADENRNVIYIAAEDEGIYRYSTNSQGVLQNQRQDVALIKDKRYLDADVEGLAMYYSSDTAGYLIASVQGKSEYAVFDRSFSQGQPNKYRKNFSIDGVERTDGLDVMNINLGGAFSQGLLAVHDGEGDSPTRYKFVKWQDIANAGNDKLASNSSYNVSKGDSEDVGNPDNSGKISGSFNLKNGRYDGWLDGDDFLVVDLDDSNNGQSKKWNFEHLSNNNYKIKNVKYNQWLYVNNGTVMLSESRAGFGTTWTAVEKGNNTYNFKNTDTGKFLDADSDFTIDLSNTAKLDDEWRLVN